MSLEEESKIQNINVKGIRGHPKRYLVKYDGKLYRLPAHSEKHAEFLTRMYSGGMKPENKNKKAKTVKKL